MDLCIITETLLQDTTSDEAWMKANDLNNIYTMWNANRIGRKGGGFALVVAKRCRVTTARRGNMVSMQFIAASVNLGVVNIEIWAHTIQHILRRLQLQMQPL